MKTRPIKKEDKNELLVLFRQLVGFDIDFDINSIINDKNCHSYVLEDDGKIIGSATLSIYSSPVKKRTGVVEDVVIHESYRGKGLGRKLMEEIIKIGKQEDLSLITLTSNPKREVARSLYQSLGFELSNTGFFKLKLDN